MPKPDETDDSKDIIDADSIKSVVDTANAENEKDLTDQDEDDADEEIDEGGDDEDKDDDSDKDDSEEEDSDDDDDDEEEDKPDSKKTPVERKFQNLAAEDDAGYIANLEKAYENSTAEALRISNEKSASDRRIDAIIEAAAKDPKLAEQLNKVLDGAAASSNDGGGDGGSQGGVSPTDNPFLVDQQTAWRKKSEEEVAAIVAANPEIVSDPKLSAEVKHWMEVFSKEEYQNNKRLMSGGEAMEAAMRHLKIEDKRSKQKTAKALKDLAAPTRPKGTPKKKTSKKNVSEAAFKFGELMGVSKEQVEKHAQS